MQKSKRVLINQNAPTILTCLGGVGVIVTAIFAARATPKAISLIKQAEQEKGEELTKWEKVQVVAPKYIPTILIGGTTLACIFGANMLNKRQQASLTSAYALLDQSYKRYREKLIELHGEEMHNEIIDSIAADAEDATAIYPYVESGWGCYTQYLEDDYSEPKLFYDVYGRRYFKAPLEQVLQAEYHINRIYTTQGYAVLNEFYDFLGIAHIDGGDDLGWAVSDECTYWIDFNHRKTELKDGTICYLIDMIVEPSLEWKELYGYD
jgi:hypothetical protein